MVLRLLCVLLSWFLEGLSLIFSAACDHLRAQGLYLSECKGRQSSARRVSAPDGTAAASCLGHKMEGNDWASLVWSFVRALKLSTANPLR